MKYIIEIEDEPLWRQSALHGEDAVFKAKGFNALVFDKEGLDKLTPLDKELDEAYQRGYEVGSHEATTLEYQQGLDDAWEYARKIAHCALWGVYRDETDASSVCAQDVLDYYSASEALAKLREYEQQKADEIKVGDEVKSLDTGLAYIIHGIDGKYVEGYNFKSRLTCYRNKNNFKKTGRHFPQVAELLEAMKEGAE